MKKFHSGFVALIGRPNVGKSTLMNCLIGEKIAITSHKPQTTRNKITSILTKDDFQCVFLDTPGIHKPKSKLGEYMMRSAETTFNEVDLVLMLIEPTTEVQTMDEYVLERIKNVKTPVVLVINKIDTVEREALLEVISVYSNREQALSVLKSHPCVQTISMRENDICVRFTGDKQDEALLLQQLIDAEVLVSSFVRETGSLESVFMQLTERKEERSVLSYEAESGL